MPMAHSTKILTTRRRRRKLHLTKSWVNLDGHGRLRCFDGSFGIYEVAGRRADLQLWR